MRYTRTFMSVTSLFQLLVLGAIWGSSFILMRIQSPVLGPVWTAAIRLLVGGGALALYAQATSVRFDWQHHWRRYLVIGVLNSGLPFLLGAYASLTVPASYAVILNSSTPMFGAIYAAIWLGEPLTPVKVLGLAIGTLGVALVARVGPLAITPEIALGMVALLGAAACYGLAGVYLKKRGQGLKPLAIAGASQILAGALLLPGIPLGRSMGTLTPGVVASVLCLSLVCSAVAYVLYYRLIADIGPTRALTVTFLMPVFGMIWSTTFLHERLTPAMVGGAALILLGTCLVLGVFQRRGIR